jgi:hypothetical protein
MIALSIQRYAPAPVDAGLTPWINVLLCWFAGGSFLLLVFPGLRGVDPWFGWLPFWLVVAPALDLVVLRHRWIAVRLRAGVSRLQSRRRSSRRQARPMPQRSRRSVRRTSRGAGVEAVTPN